MKLKLLVIALTITSLNCFSQSETANTKEWIYIGSVKGDKLYVKNKYVAKSASKIKIWSRLLENVVYIKGEKYVNTTTNILYLVDCKENKIKVLYSIIYDSQRNIISESDVDDFNEFQDVIPGSMGEGVVEKTCELFQ